MQRNYKWLALIGLISSLAQAQEPAWNLVLVLNDSEIHTARADSAEAALRAAKANQQLRNYTVEHGEQASSRTMRQQMEAMGLRFDGDRVVGFDTDRLTQQQSVAAPEKPALDFEWKRAGIGGLGGEPAVKLRHIKDGRTRWVANGGHVDGWQVSIHASRVMITREGDRQIL